MHIILTKGPNLGLWDPNKSLCGGGFINAEEPNVVPSQVSHILTEAGAQLQTGNQADMRYAKINSPI
eukprot:c29052_g6_i1 orf=430-630(+)